ncbi:MAG: DUF4458 domain-containing protein, partial [Bacteroides sp.]
MKSLLKIALISISFVGLLLCAGCSDDELVSPTGEHGYMQVKLYKKGAISRASNLETGSELAFLRDVRKIVLTLSSNSKEFVVALTPKAVSDDAAEYGLITEPVELMPGKYTVKYYMIYGENVVDDQAEILQSGTPDEETLFEIESRHITTLDFPIQAVLKGQFAAVFGKDLSGIATPISRASIDNSSFKYEEIATAVFTFKHRANGIDYLENYPVKAKKIKGESLFSTDTIPLNAGEYTLSHFKLYNKNSALIYATDNEQKINVKHYAVSRDTVNVKMHETDAIRDYIALYNIWIAMDGKNWAWAGDEHTANANWIFKFADGTPRPVDTWGDQPGVALNGNGRVSSLNIGGFNPKGMVPDAIGDLTALEVLYLGYHSEEGGVPHEDGMVDVLNPYALAKKGVDLRANRMKIAGERSALRKQREQTPSKLLYDIKNSSTFKFTTYAQNTGAMSNRITGISERIGNLEGSLTTLFIGNGYIKELPKSFSKLVNLTDLEIYNCPMTTFPSILKELPNLVSLNFSMMRDLDIAQTDKNLDEFFRVGKSRGLIQVLYLTNNKLKILPESMKNLKKLGLLDIAYNKLTTLPALGLDVAPTQLFADCNLLTSIPNNFCKVDDLEKFSVSCNQLTEFPLLLSNKKNAGKYSIEEVDLSVNKIAGFEAGFEGIRVEKLNLNSNKFGTASKSGAFPTEFSTTKSEINFLRLCYNEIKELKAEAIKNLKVLQAL